MAGFMHANASSCGMKRSSKCRAQLPRVSMPMKFTTWTFGNSLQISSAIFVRRWQFHFVTTMRSSMAMPSAMRCFNPSKVCRKLPLLLVIRSCNSAVSPCKGIATQRCCGQNSTSFFTSSSEAKERPLLKRRVSIRGNRSASRCITWRNVFNRSVGSPPVTTT